MILRTNTIYYYLLFCNDVLNLKCTAIAIVLCYLFKRTICLHILHVIVLDNNSNTSIHCNTLLLHACIAMDNTPLSTYTAYKANYMYFSFIIAISLNLWKLTAHKSYPQFSSGICFRCLFWLCIFY